MSISAVDPVPSGDVRQSSRGEVAGASARIVLAFRRGAYQPKRRVPFMNASMPVNPFVPGRGHLPPCLAGRSAEQNELNALLAYLKAGKGAPRDLILTGPRDNGKTVLLRWLQREIEVAEQNLDAVWLTPADMRNLDELANLLVPPSRFDALRPDNLSFAVGLGRFGWELGGRPGSLTQLLKERCQRRPLALLVDEAHTLGKDLGQALLNASQSVSSEAPFLLALAGTPGLQNHLNSMSATFWSRGRKLGVGLLDEAASAQALTQPLAEQRQRSHLRTKRFSRSWLKASAIPTSCNSGAPSYGRPRRKQAQPELMKPWLPRRNRALMGNEPPITTTGARN